MIVTKSTLIGRDADLLAAMAARSLVNVSVSLATLDEELSRRMEPRAAGPRPRLGVIERLSRLGVPVRVLVAPVIPGLTDHEVEKVLGAARDAGARDAGYVLLRLPLEVAGLFHEWLDAQYPLRAGKVRSLVRQTAGGRDYQSGFGTRMRGTGPVADLIARRFERRRRRLGFAALPPLDSSCFRPPAEEPGGGPDDRAREPAGARARTPARAAEAAGQLGRPR